VQESGLERIVDESGVGGARPPQMGLSAAAFTFMLCWNEFIVAQVLNTKPGRTPRPPVERDAPEVP